MKLQIISQINEQECGVCAITSLHNYFYKHNQLTKEQVLDKSQISNLGMTLFDLEVLGQHVGLECESYEVKWAEFLNLKISGYFILLVATNDGQTNHYVIARKNKKQIEIFDSSSNQPIKLSYNDFKSMYLNVVVLVKKQPSKLFDKVFGKTKTLLIFDIKFVLINLLLSVLVLCTSIVCASFLNWIIDLAIDKSSINNLITISFIFILVYCLNDLLTYISSLYVSNQTRTYFMLFTSKILKNLPNKKFDFLNKVDKQWIYKIDECVYNISNFCIIEINKFITNIIFACICICIIGSINYWLLIFCLLFMVVEFVFFLFSYKKKKEKFLNLVRSENKNTIFYKRLINSLESDIWESRRRKLIFQIKDNYSYIYKNFSDVNLFRGNTNLFKSLIKGVLEIIMIALMGYFVITSNNLTIGSITFLIASFSLFRTSCNDICNYFLAKLEFDIYWQVYKDLTNVSNMQLNKEILNFREINKLTFICNGREINLFQNKANNQIKDNCLNLFIKSQKIKIENQDVDINIIETKNKFILIDEFTKPDTQTFLNEFENNFSLYGQYVRYFKLDLNKKKQSFYDCIIINLLSLLGEREKIILIDSLNKYIRKKDKLVIKQLINRIRKHNSVFLVGKEEYD